jgi:uncharacterized membrane protein YfcA
MNNYIITAILGIISGIIGGSVGTSGSNVIIPGLIMFKISPNYQTAVGTTLLTILPPLSIGAVYSYWKKKKIQLDISIILMVTYAIAAFFGAYIALHYVSGKTLSLCYAIYLLMISVYFFYRYFTL